MKYCFDFGCCLETNEVLRELARVCHAAGYEVQILPAMSGTIDYPARLKELNVPWDRIDVVIDDGNRDAVAQRKKQILARTRPDRFFDDRIENVRAAESLGIAAVLVVPGC
jgi:hypothetical protein